mmetsp:Transcript_18864/g.32242  ORF Transcript_18864/g.32242 Transcript_18864/m.32242 type:complete len:118 (+) Transcript_18864:102-455(+)
MWGLGWVAEWWSSSRTTSTPKINADQQERQDRKCKAFSTGLQGCRRANPDNPEVCKNLEQRLFTCYADAFAKVEANEQKKCFTKLYTSGAYKGRGHCMPEEDAIRKALAARGCKTLV